MKFVINFINLSQFFQTIHQINKHWILKTNPCSSLIIKEELINNSEGALILIDNYLLNTKHDTIIIPKDINRIDFDYFIKKIHNSKSKDKTKELYIKYKEQLQKTKS